MDIDSQHIPAGMILIRKGGRPKADARNLAVYFTRLWRTEILGEQVKKADAWILEHWKNSNGITEESTIRRAIRAAKEGPIVDGRVTRLPNSYDPRTTFGIYDGPVIYEIFPAEGKIEDWATVWTWKEGMRCAHQHTLRVITAEFVLVDELPPVPEDVLKNLPESVPFPLPPSII